MTRDEVGQQIFRVKWISQKVLNVSSVWNGSIILHQWSFCQQYNYSVVMGCRVVHAETKRVEGSAY
jgi:hypothetical protein